MIRHVITATLATAVVLTLSTGCSSAMNPTAQTSTTSHRQATQPDWEWPLRFTSHNFSAKCFDTQSCRIVYAGLPQGSDEPRPSLASTGYPLEKLITGTHIGIRNFPPPAQVTWQAKDGTPLQAEVDMAEIFKDRLIHHNLRREEISEIGSIPPPDIILVVDDRTIKVYMRAFISTKEYQIPGNRYSKNRYDLIEVYSQTY